MMFTASAGLQALAKQLAVHQHVSASTHHPQLQADASAAADGSLPADMRGQLNMQQRCRFAAGALKV
jgi:hypothetical protein